MTRKSRVVVASIESADGLRCVDIFRRPDGRYSYDEWRRDPEDPSGWHATGADAAKAFATQAAALKAARRTVAWLAAV